MGWSLSVLLLQIEQRVISPEIASVMSELWATSTNMFVSDDSVGSTAALAERIVTLSPQSLRNIQDAYVRISPAGSASRASQEKSARERVRAAISADEVEAVLARLPEATLTKLERFEEIWEEIADSSTQEVLGHALEKLSHELKSSLPRISRATEAVLKVWMLRDFVTLWMDGLKLNDEKRSGRRMMLLDTEKTIDAYNYLLAEGISASRVKGREIELVTTGHEARLEEESGIAVHARSGDIISGLSLASFATLFLADPARGLEVADLVGDYVWTARRVLPTDPTRLEAIRRIGEAIRAVRHAVEAASDLYAELNPVWDVMKVMERINALLQTPGELWRLVNYLRGVARK
jgi:hypothetical protein